MSTSGSIVDHDAIYEQLPNALTYALRSFGPGNDPDAWSKATAADLVAHLTKEITFTVGKAVTEQSIAESVAWIQSKSACWPTEPCWVKRDVKHKPARTVVDAELPFDLTKEA